MTLTERNLVIEQLEQLHTYTRNDPLLATTEAYLVKLECLEEVDRAIKIIKRQPLKSSHTRSARIYGGLPVSAGGKEE